MANMYLTYLKLLIGIKHPLNVVIVGANDGKINDPIYDFAMSMSYKTNILLIEPNKDLLPYLENNYSQHPSHQIANCAIGEEGVLTLYAIKQKFWERFQPDYAKGWPPYRAATGITSSSKSHLEEPLARENINVEDAIEILKVPAKELKALLIEHEWPIPIDVLQIDAEGYDDFVIFNSNIEQTRPKLIYFENNHIPSERMALLLEHLTNNRYKTHWIGGDCLSVDTLVNFTSTSLNLSLNISLN